MFRRLFLDHPRTVGETYGDHFIVASSFGCRMIGAGIACLLHAVVPAIFPTTGSTAIERLHKIMVVNRRRSAAASSGE